MFLLVVCACADEPTCRCCSTPHRPSAHKPPSCENVFKATCELNLGNKYLSVGFWPEALQHCTAALALASSIDNPKDCIEKARSGIREQRRAYISLRLTFVYAMVLNKQFEPAENELKSLRDFEKLESDKLGPLDPADDQLIIGANTQIATEKAREWPAALPTALGLRDWLPGVFTQSLRILSYLLIIAVLWLFLYLLREGWRWWRWHNLNGPIRWMVSSIADETKQLAAGAVMDALNIFHNPLFQPLKTSSLLAVPPALADDSADPSCLVWRNFLADIAAKKSSGTRGYLSDLIEDIEMEKFTRHTFQQVNAFEDINVKLGIVEASLGAIVRNVQRWWTKGWPTVTGSVTIEKVGESSFASIRLICNYGLKRSSQQGPLAPDDADVDPGVLFADERTFAVFASTRQDEFSDAVALASQRAAFRLLYRLAKRPADPTLAIAASSYRQGMRLLMSVL